MASTISIHQAKVYDWLKRASGWSTSQDIAAGAGTGQRVTRAHCLTLTKLGVCERLEVFPSHQYRLRKAMSAEARNHVARLEEVLAIAR